MRKLAMLTGTAFTLILSACAGSSSESKANSEANMDQATRYEEDNTRRRVNDNQGSGPLGSQTNPIKCDGLDGARAYLDRLHGPNGEKVSYTEIGSAGIGPFGSLMYIYDISYPTPEGGKQAQIFMDPDFAEYSENKPATGFTLK